MKSPVLRSSRKAVRKPLWFAYVIVQALFLFSVYVSGLLERDLDPENSSLHWKATFPNTSLEFEKQCYTKLLGISGIESRSSPRISAIEMNCTTSLYFGVECKVLCLKTKSDHDRDPRFPKVFSTSTNTSCSYAKTANGRNPPAYFIEAMKKKLLTEVQDHGEIPGYFATFCCYFQDKEVNCPQANQSDCFFERKVHLGRTWHGHLLILFLLLNLVPPCTVLMLLLAINLKHRIQRSRLAKASRTYEPNPFLVGRKVSSKALEETLSMCDDRRLRFLKSFFFSEDKAKVWGSAVRFSSRLSAVWAELDGYPGLVWFCLMDGECIIFSIRSTSSEKKGEIQTMFITYGDDTKKIDCLNLPSERIDWSTLLQSAADFQETDNAIRAVLIACIVCAHARGGKSCAPRALVPQNLKSLSTRIHYDEPIDVDLMTTLADPMSVDGLLYFSCGLGTMANAAGQEKGVCHLQGVQPGLANWEKAVAIDVEEDIPILYGYGRFLDTKVACKTTEIRDIRRRIPKRGGTSKLLWAVKNVAETLADDGILDLAAAASVIFATKGSFLGSRSSRKIRGDVLIVGRDGIYKSSRFLGVAVEGSLEVNLALVKVGMKIGREPDTAKDRRVETLSEVAEHILGRKFRFQYFHHYKENTVRGPEDLWSDEAAVCNTLVALLCRKFGRFTGFSAVTSTISSIRTFPSYSMEADIFLPLLSVWEPLHSVVRRSNPQPRITLALQVLTCTYTENKNDAFRSQLWNVLVRMIATWKSCNPECVREFILALWEPLISKECEIWISGRRVLACKSYPTKDINETEDSAIRIAADLTTTF